MMINGAKKHFINQFEHHNYFDSPTKLFSFYIQLNFSKIVSFRIKNNYV